MRCSTGEAEVAIRHVRQRVAHEEATEALDPTVLDQRVRERRKVVAAVAFCTRKRGGGERLQAAARMQPAHGPRACDVRHGTYSGRTAAPELRGPALAVATVYSCMLQNACHGMRHVAERVSRYAACCMLHRPP